MLPSASGLPPALPPGESLNPFADDVCAGPFGVAENRSVPGLNGDILGQLTTTIDERQSSAGRAGGQPLLLLTAPRAGYGKTHLLGRLAAAANGQVVLVPLAFRLEDTIGISAVAVRGLESMARAEATREGWTKLREACAGVCATLVRRLIENGTLPCANPEQALRVLGGDPIEVFDEKGSARLIGDWVRRFEGQLRKPMTEQAMKRVPAIPTALESWVNAMLNHALDGGMSHMAVLRMLAADESNEGPVTWLRLLGLFTAASFVEAMFFGQLGAFVPLYLPQLGIAIPAATLRRFWTMIAHYHGQKWNAAELARSLGASEPTTRKYLDILTGMYLV
ncbi:MAG: DUF4143 domain-containing protein, partial [Verrucomicrobia bacterium]|nr:DUF4143 domain-containing protein [Verrucomicrobiota bacterium]